MDYEVSMAIRKEAEEMVSSTIYSAVMELSRILSDELKDTNK